MAKISRDKSLDSLKKISDELSSGLPSGAIVNDTLQRAISENPFQKIPFNLTNNISLKNFDTPTITSKQFDNAKNATAFIKGIDPSNLSGSIPFGLNIAEMVKKNSGPLKSPLSGNMTSMLTKLASGNFPIDLKFNIAQLANLEDEIEKLQSIAVQTPEITSKINELKDKTELLMKKVNSQ